MSMKGLKIARFAAGVVPRNCKALLTWKMLDKLVRFLDASHQQQVSLFVLTAWHFLLRVQSEAIDITRARLKTLSSSLQVGIQQCGYRTKLCVCDFRAEHTDLVDR